MNLGTLRRRGESPDLNPQTESPDRRTDSIKSTPNPQTPAKIAPKIRGVAPYPACDPDKFRLIPDSPIVWGL